MGNYKISLQAQQDLQDIYSYGVETHGESQADNFYDAIYDCLDLIADTPLTWTRVENIKPGYRRYIYRKGRARTSIYYRIVEDTVEIMAIIQRQDVEQRSVR